MATNEFLQTGSAPTPSISPRKIKMLNRDKPLGQRVKPRRMS